MKIPKLSVGFLSLSISSRIFYQGPFNTKPVISWADAGLDKNSDYCDRTQVSFFQFLSRLNFLSVCGYGLRRKSQWCVDRISRRAKFGFILQSFSILSIKRVQKYNLSIKTQLDISNIDRGGGSNCVNHVKTS